ncbi:hypothetical protein [Hymenobacter defluvii]|uniref:Uncharacterized protein n=1 Tax=Hymenobacter defluvii TaxID=2054411 RepID=A0ABS3TF10_9BACT|nr:hypothetical protein [Hymenobacter defluvii]MBO3272241.1 hypothetical protein [Hymenobacter defluvii]
MEKNAIQDLLNEAEITSKKIYTTAIVFLGLGLLIAGGGVLYFYFSNDALFLDRAFYEDNINVLQADKNNLTKNNKLLATAYDKKLKMDSIDAKIINSLAKLNKETIASYAELYNSIVKSSAAAKDGQQQLDYIFTKLEKHRPLFERYNKAYGVAMGPVDKSNELLEEKSDIIRAYRTSVNAPDKPLKLTNVYDKPELVFSPKLVYGFFSRLGGLVFIELIAFFILKQYRINMNDFKYYDSIVRQARTNLYLISKVDAIEDNKDKVDILGKLFSNASFDQKQFSHNDSDSVVSSNDIDSLKKLFDSIKELIKK